MIELRAWAASLLPRTSAMLARSHAVRAVVRELTKNPEWNITDAALAAVMPWAAEGIERFYGGRGPALREVLSTSEIRLLDRWLASEIRALRLRWCILDPTCGGDAASTREALATLRSEMHARGVPTSMAAAVSRLRDTSGLERDGKRSG